MKICRFDAASLGTNRIGVVRGDMVHDVTEILHQLPPLHYPLAFGDHLIAHLPALRSDMESLADTAKTFPVAEVRLRSPVANPSKIIGTPANYLAHVEEARADQEISVYHAGKQRTITEQGLFLKASSSLVGPGDGVHLRFPDRRTDHEAELGVVIGKIVEQISEEEALSAVAGYAIALDMVVRGKEDRSFRKSPDSYAVLGPWLVTADELGDPTALDFSLSVGGEQRQAANTSEMIIGIAKQIAWAASLYTLYPGDIIMTGTCQGVAPVKPGDVMHVAFERIGAMDVPVHEAR
jgi:2-keto-4-pentenoate hydratase/2-oxohepta-3-ene-1,7-dioic acid hydratase in catechol pathway